MTDPVDEDVAGAPDPWQGTAAEPDVVVPGRRPSVAPLTFRAAMAHLAAGVAVLTTLDPVGRDVGITVSSVTSVSLHPPLVLVCVRRGGFVHDSLYVSDGWAVTMLAADQVDLARYAARHRHPGDHDDFSRWPARPAVASRALVLTGGVAAVDCEPHAFVDAGDHTVCIGRVVEVATDVSGGAPLLYSVRAYHGLGGALG